MMIFVRWQVNFVDPLLRSPLVSDAAFETLMKLTRCIAPPLCNWAPEIAAALRIISTNEVHLVCDLIPSVGEGEVQDKPSIGLFERITSGLLTSCKAGPLPADTFTFIFPVLPFLYGHCNSLLLYLYLSSVLITCPCQIMEQILLSSKKTGLHDDALQIISLHLDPILPLPRLRMLSVISLNHDSAVLFVNYCGPFFTFLNILFCRFCIMSLVLLQPIKHQLDLC